MPHLLPTETLPEREQQTLLQVARDALVAVANGQRYIVQDEANALLAKQGACFVTLTQQGQLRGCIGSLQAYRPLVIDVAENARAAASRDPRFPPVRPDEVAGMHIEISVLTPPQAMQFASEADLLQQLTPFVDGLVLEEGSHRSTFLPLVWQQLPQPADFLRQLKLKAGLPQHYWSNTIKFYRYFTQVFEEKCNPG